mgnify:FL=1
MSRKEMRESLFLIGFMGAGKSAVSACLHEVYGMRLLEMDQEIERREGMSIPEIFEKKGEEYFRGLETGLLRELKGDSGTVVSCGGGAAMREENVKLMKEAGKIILLRARPETILKRVAGSDDRPLLRGRRTVEGIRDLMEGRRPRYEAAADLTVDTDEKTVDEICREILERTGAEN